MAIIAKNTDTQNTLIVYISAGKSISIPAGGQVELLNYATKIEIANSDVAFHVDQGNIIINDGTKDLTKLKALKYVWDMPLEATNVTADGDWHVVNENFGHVTGNNIVNWTFEKFLDASISYSEKYLIPNNKTLTLNFIEAGSSSVSTNVTLEYYDMINGTLCRINPEVRVEETYLITVDGAHSSGATTIAVSDTDTNTLQQVETGLCYGFKDGSNDTFYDIVTDISTGNSTITLQNGLPNDIADGTLVGLVDRVVGQKGNKSSFGIINWVTPPRFFGDGDRYLKITIENNDPTNGGLVTGTFNGWLTPTDDGD